MDNKKIGAFIAMNRKKKGLTQEQLGERLGVSNKTISRWENGNYMPDISLLQSLSKELDISLNELLSGEKIEEEKVMEYSEMNLANTIDYSARVIKNEYKKISMFLMIVGVFMCLYTFNFVESENSFARIFLIIGIVLVVVGVFREIKIISLWKKLFVSFGLFMVLFIAFFMADYFKVSELKQPPIFRYMVLTNHDETKIVEYKNMFYNVFQINADTPNEYFLIDNKKSYTIDTVPVSPFNRDKSGIQNIVQYKNKYIGNNSNTGNLINALPLSEYGFVFEIDSKNCGLIIDYHFTDWYNNENLYIEKSLIYNAVSTFSMIDNLEYIKFNFSGSTYSITREDIVQNYPHYSKIFTKNEINQDNFNKYVEQKMNDKRFITEMFSLFDKTNH